MNYYKNEKIQDICQHCLFQFECNDFKICFAMKVLNKLIEKRLLKLNDVYKIVRELELEIMNEIPTAEEIEEVLKSLKPEDLVDDD